MSGIEVRRLRFSYGTHEVLSDVSFAACPGQLTAVIGANGAGKSTLFKCILGLLPKYGGSIRVGGDEVSSLAPKELAHRLAYIPQTHYPSFNYLAADMVLMGATHTLGTFSMPKASQKERAYGAMETVGIIHLADKGFCRLSGGEQQLVLIARALCQGSDTLIMDEPTASLDFGNQLKVLSCVRELARSGYTVLMSSHNPQHALEFADRVVAIDGGAAAAQGTPADVLDACLMERLYGVRVAFIDTEAGRLISLSNEYTEGPRYK